MTNEANLYEALRRQLVQLRSEFDILKLTIDGNPFIGLKGVLRRVDEIESTAILLSKQHDDERRQHAQEIKDERIWRIGLVISLGLTLIVLAALVVSVLGGFRP
ncbi:MAG: hypothetical protein H0U60_00140 [Blastocatellia bacterium]|nr:hypothetical protein [Blastocatellia bacterium]